MATVHSYIRFSTEKQSERHGGDSQRRQLENSAAWIKRHKHTLSNLEFRDLGKSAHKGDRQKALKAFLKSIEEGKVKPGDILLVENVDRLSRKGVRPTQKLVNSILDAGVDIAILSPVEKVYRAADINDIGGTIELAAFAYGAYVYSENLSHRVKNYHRAARAVLKATGRKLKQHRPAWITPDHKLDPAKAETVRYIFRRTIEGIGAPALCRELNAQKHPPMGYSKQWNTTYVRQILTGRLVLGEYVPHVMDEAGNRVPEAETLIGYYPAVVDEKTWLAAQSSIAGRKKERGPSSGFVNLFTGLLWHVPDNCPAHVHTYVQKGKVIRRIKSYAAKSMVEGSSMATLDLEQFEENFLWFLDDVPMSVFGDSTQNLELQAIRGQIEQKTKRFAEINDQLTGDDVPLFVLIPAAKRLESELQALQKKERELASRNVNSPAETISAAKRLGKLPLDTAEARQRMREAIKQAVERINIVPVKLGKRRRDPVGAAVEIIFRNGKRDQLVTCLDARIALRDAASNMPPLHELPDVKGFMSRLEKGIVEMFFRPA